MQAWQRTQVEAQQQGMSYCLGLLQSACCWQLAVVIQAFMRASE
jgi:hypothetical protein